MRQVATADRIREFMRAIGREAAHSSRVFFSGPPLEESK